MAGTPLGSPQKTDGKTEVGLCDLLLQVAGRDTNRLPGARRHFQVLRAAIPHMTAAQAEIASTRIRVLETKWGPVLANRYDLSCYTPEIWEIPPERITANWLATRRNPERYCKVMNRAATAVLSGVTCLSDILEFAFAQETDRVMDGVGLDSFREWLFQLRIAVPEGKAVYRAGQFCKWWVDDMDPQNTKSGAYAACMRQLVP